ncbi:uncharacterized protein ACO6RY_14597 [Pungitius sinensis]
MFWVGGQPEDEDVREDREPGRLLLGEEGGLVAAGDRRGVPGADERGDGHGRGFGGGGGRCGAGPPPVQYSGGPLRPSCVVV